MQTSANQNQEISFNKTFSQAGLQSFLVKMLAYNKFELPTPIQYYAIKTCIQNKDCSLICRSKSGTGKTIAYASLTLLNLADMQKIENKTYCIVLVPTRQLAVQVYQNYKSLLDCILQLKQLFCQQKKIKQKLKHLNVMLSIGGISFEDDRKKYRQSPANIVVCTIGRLFQLFKNNCLILGKDMFTIFDQGDKILGNLNSDDKLKKILGILPVNSKWYVFSATYTKKMIQDISKIKKCVYLHTLLKGNQLQVVITTDLQNQLKLDDKQLQNNPNKVNQNQDNSNLSLQNIKKYQIKINPDGSLFDQKIFKLQELLSSLNFQKCLIFLQKKSFLQQISQSLSSFPHILIHGSLSQAARFRMMNCINNTKIIIASDLLSRGIDIRLDLVILFDARQGDTFWHRIGRTGRYGRTGVVISLDSIQDINWKDYSVGQVNQILGGIQKFQKKQWYGGHLTQISKWKEVDEKLQAQNNYKYFDQSKLEHNLKQISKIQQKMGKSLQKQQIQQKSISSSKYKYIKSTYKQILSSLKTKKQLQNFIKQNILKCKDCNQLIKNTNLLTGYQFQLLKYVSQHHQ